MKKILLKSMMLLCLLVMGANANATVYKLVTSSADLVAGCNYIMADGTDGAVNVVSTESNTNNRKTTTGTASEGNITSSEAMMTFTLGGTSNAWTFTTTNYKGTDGFLYNDDTSNNRLKVGSNTTTNAFTISFSNNEISSITCNGNTSKGVMCFNGTLVACYASKSNAYKVPQLYKEVINAVPYTVTFDAGTNGTCSITSLTEASAGAGVTLPACTPNSGYGFAGWSTTNGGTTPDAGKAGETYNPTATTTLYAVYKTQYTVTWNVNGNITNTTVLEGDDIEFDDPAQTEINGKKFQGWVASPIASITNVEPSFVTSATASEDVTYYAVYATETDSGNDIWVKISAVNKVVPGTYALISQNGNYYVPNTAATGSCPTATAITKTAGVIDVKDNMKWTVTGDNTNGYNFAHYVEATSTTNYLWGGSANDAPRVNTTSGKANATKDWFVELNATYGVVLYNNAAAEKHYLKMYNTTDWRNYISAPDASAANLYRLEKDKTVTGYCTSVSTDITVTAAGYTTYFNSTQAVELPEGVTGYVWSDGLVEIYDEEFNVIPAGEPVVLKAAVGDYTLNFTTTTEPTCKEYELNDLEGTDVATAITPENGYYFYGLSLNAAGEANSVGFYWMEENGAAFTNGAHKAYLKLPQTPGAKSAFRFNNTTGIKTLNNEQSVSKAVKRIMNGQLVIEKAGKMFNAAGAEMK